MNRYLFFILFIFLVNALAFSGELSDTYKANDSGEMNITVTDTEEEEIILINKVNLKKSVFQFELSTDMRGGFIVGALILRAQASLSFGSPVLFLFGCDYYVFDFSIDENIFMPFLGFAVRLYLARYFYLEFIFDCSSNLRLSCVETFLKLTLFRNKLINICYIQGIEYLFGITNMYGYPTRDNWINCPIGMGITFTIIDV